MLKAVTAKPKDPAQKRPLVNFINFVYQLTPDVCWLLLRRDLDVTGGQDAAVALTDTGRNMDLQINMKAASEDDCTLGEGFASELPPCHLPLWVQPM